MLTQAEREYQRNWYHANKAVVGPRKNARQAKQYRFLQHVAREIKMMFGCSECGFCAHPRALEFHHRDPSTKSFSIGEPCGCSLATLLKEISKCDVLCANCHAIRHA